MLRDDDAERGAGLGSVPMRERRARKAMRSRERLRFLLAVLVLLIPWRFAPESLPTAAPKGRALLLSGPEPRKGLPFFPPNVIPALYGEYLVDTGRIPVFSTREPLALSGSWHAVLGPGWPATGIRAYRLAREGGVVLLLRTAKYSLFLLLPPDLEAYRAFSLALERRFSFFFDNAADDAELSFPASVDFQ